MIESLVDLGRSFTDNYPDVLPIGIELPLKVQALDIRVGDRVLIYFNTKMQVCTVRDILDSGQTNITLSVFIGDHYRHTASRVVRFRPDATLTLAA